MSDVFTLTINGRVRSLDGVTAPAPLATVLEALAMRADRVAVEHNGELAPRALWAEHLVQDGDRLEIVHFVGGGAA